MDLCNGWPRIVPLLFGACLFPAGGAGLRLQIAVTSAWANFELRQHQRSALRSCSLHWDSTDNEVEQIFFMGELTGSVVAERAQMEINQYGDLVAVGGAEIDDFDDSLKVAVSVRALRVLNAITWLLLHRPDLDYVAHMQDDVFLHVPRLVDIVAQRDNASLALGIIHDGKALTVGGEEAAVLPCETCAVNPEHESQCRARLQAAPGGITFRGCLHLVQRCCGGRSAATRDASSGDAGDGPGGDDCEHPLEGCLEAGHQAGIAASTYYGASSAPRGLHGAGWVLGRRVATFLGENAVYLRRRGHLDVLLGFWLAALEDVDFSALPEGALHDDSRTCPHSGVILATSMDERRWQEQFDPKTCELRCDTG